MITHEELSAACERSVVLELYVQKNRKPKLDDEGNACAQRTRFAGRSGPLGHISEHLTVDSKHWVKAVFDTRELINFLYWHCQKTHPKFFLHSFIHPAKISQ